MIKILTALAATAVLAAAAGSASAAEIQVKALNSGTQGAMAFDPPFVKIKLGDTVRVVAVDKGHNIESVIGMAPAGAAPFKGLMSKDVVLTFAGPGVYGFKCNPHFGMGMVFVVEVGSKPANLAQAKEVAEHTPPMARKRFAAELAEVK